MVFCNIFLIYYNPGLQKQVARWLFLEKYLNTFICWKDFSESDLTNFYSKMQVKESWSNDFLESLYLLVETSRNKQK